MAKLHIYFETMAGTHLSDAVRALRDGGSADALYEQSVRTAPLGELGEDEYSIARDVAEYERVAHSRRALLFAAVAAEAYANDFLYDKWEGRQDREALVRLSTVDKYVLLSQLAGRPDPLNRGSEPIQTIRRLFKLRDELVHAAPREDLTYVPERHNPEEAARCIVAVADAGARLFDAVEPMSVLGYVLASRTRLLQYGEQAAASLPEVDDPPSVRDLLDEARRALRSD